MPSDLDRRRTADKARIVDIAASRTLPAYYYTDPAVLEIERRELFFRTWQYACHASVLAEPGCYTTFSIFDQDIMLVHGQDGVVRAFYNVCAHRGHQLVAGSGQKTRLTCPYHAWTYALDGRLVGVRGGEHTTKVAKSEICLSEIRVDRLLDFYFINLDPDAQPLAAYAPGLEAEIAAATPGWQDFVVTDNWRAFGAPFACNWKALVDNYLECYHCETAHPTFCDMFDCTGIRHDFAANHMRQHLPSAHKAENAAYALDLDHHVLDGNFWFLFPSTLLGYIPGAPSLSISRIVPTGAETCLRETEVYVAPDADPAHLKARDAFGAEKVGAEDRALVESVQRGMRQMGFNQGLYMIDPEEETFTEEGVRFFHSRYRDALEGVISAETR
ncbi:MAG: aromatic ring-hydroxylating dioxygenase subunit alpha [Pseudomonadota bacterium]